MNIPDTLPRADLPFAGLVAFVAAARHGSVSRAAEDLALTQSAVSQRILKLEAHVGQRLFLRQGHGVKLTGAGELLLQTAADTLARLQAGLERIEPYRSKASLLIGCPNDIAQGWLLPRLGGLRALHPGLEVWLLSDRELTDIDRIDVDLVISRRPLRRTDVECLPWLTDRSIAVAGPRTAERLAALPWPRLLAKAPVLLLESEPEWAGRLASTSAKAVKGQQRAATLHDENLLLEAAALEHGVACVSALLASQALASGRVVALPQVPEAPRPGLWLMRSRLTARTPLVDLAWRWLQGGGTAPAGVLS